MLHAIRSLSPLGMATLLCVAVLGTQARAGELRITFLDVDQGNSAFVLGPDGTRLLIDAGVPGKGLSSIRPYLLSIGVTDLDYSINTHWDSDHWGGFEELFKRVSGFRHLDSEVDYIDSFLLRGPKRIRVAADRI